MCNGPLLGKILLFSVPLMLSGILQLLFNAADIVVVGQFAGNEALAAVGSTGSLNNLIVNVFMGLSIGTSIMVARYYGAQDWKSIREIVHTSMLVSFICGVALFLSGFPGGSSAGAVGTRRSVCQRFYICALFLSMAGANGL